MLDYLNTDAGKQKVWSFNTITVPKYIHRHSMAEFRMEMSLRFIRTHWDILIKRLKRRYGNFSYIRVLEQHQSGVLHIHTLMSFWHNDLHTGVGKNGKPYSYSPSFKKILTDVGFGYITDNQNVTDELGNAQNAGYVVGYIAKYMNKYSQAFADAVKGKYVRRVLVSRDVGSPKDTDSLDEWVLMRYITLKDVEHAEKHNYVWVDGNTGAIITKDDFEDYDTYPPPEN